LAAPHQRNAPAHNHLLLHCLINTRGGSIVAGCFTCRLPPNCEFASDWLRAIRL